LHDRGATNLRDGIRVILAGGHGSRDRTTEQPDDEQRRQEGKWERRQRDCREQRERQLSEHDGNSELHCGRLTLLVCAP
jgi:hypothetical protein